MKVSLELDLHRWLTTVVRNKPDWEDIEDCFDLLSRLSQQEKQAFWAWLTQHDPNLKQWLVQQGRRRTGKQGTASLQDQTNP